MRAVLPQPGPRGATVSGSSSMASPAGGLGGFAKTSLKRGIDMALFFVLNVCVISECILLCEDLSLMNAMGV